MAQRGRKNSSLFQPGQATCRYYQRTRDGEHHPHPASRAFLDFLWSQCSQYLDSNALTHAKENMPGVFWELYLAYSLQSLNKVLVAQPRTKKRQIGPDLYVKNPSVWIEAIAPTPGIGEDALLDPPIGKAYNVPLREYILRLRTAIEAKTSVFRHYIDNDVIPPSEPTIIAVSGAVLPTKFLEQATPRIVRALLGVGNHVLLLNEGSGDVMGHYLHPDDTTYNAKGAPIKTDVFMDPAYAHISAVLYSCCDWLNVPTDPGGDFILIHNKIANNPLPMGWLSKGLEYWRDDEHKLKRKRYAAARNQA